VEFTYLKVKSAKCLCLLPVVLRIWSCLHHWPQEFRILSLTLRVVTRAILLGSNMHQIVPAAEASSQTPLQELTALPQTP